jgi:hypothetical protein
VRGRWLAFHKRAADFSDLNIASVTMPGTVNLYEHFHMGVFSGDAAEST